MSQAPVILGGGPAAHSRDVDPRPAPFVRTEDGEKRGHLGNGKSDGVVLQLSVVFLHPRQTACTMPKLKQECKTWKYITLLP